ncbi:hypothetical protein PGTUg99_037564 [Puccinia graminis f. sp. tritici]|uniref:Uncharacterized protein n=1 Tax=Puccinia graminis f. sp. tritici TaxID=56615 RepID=A0A5B0RAV5_PUCGR|nr:hypothetical protein PGTUg99_037564 [Puccinia graminis f. sp. tritici]
MQTADPVFEPARQLTSMVELFLSSHMLKKKETSSSGILLTHEHLVAADRGNSSPASGHVLWGQISPIQILIPSSSASCKEPGNRLKHTTQRAHLDLNYKINANILLNNPSLRAFNAPASFVPMSARLPQLSWPGDQLDPY